MKPKELLETDYTLIPNFFNCAFELIDTGGIDVKGTQAFNEEIRRQALIAIEEADGIIFVVDGRLGVTSMDLEVAQNPTSNRKACGCSS